MLCWKLYVCIKVVGKELGEVYGNRFPLAESSLRVQHGPIGHHLEEGGSSAVTMETTQALASLPDTLEMPASCSPASPRKPPQLCPCPGNMHTHAHTCTYMYIHTRTHMHIQYPETARTIPLWEALKILKISGPGTIFSFSLFPSHFPPHRNHPVYVPPEQNHQAIARCFQTRQLQDVTLLERGKNALRSEIYLIFMSRCAPPVPGCQTH